MREKTMARVSMARMAQPERSRDARLTQQGLLRLELFPPPAFVTPYVTTFFRMRCDERRIRDVQPSSLGMMAAMARGSGKMRFLDGRSEPSHRFTLQSPTSAAATFEVDGPWHLFGAALTPLGWAALTGLCATKHGNRIYDGGQVLGPALAEAAKGIAEEFERLSSEAMVERFSAAILASVRAIKPSHARFVKIAGEWLAGSIAPAVADLQARGGWSARQVQRLTDRYFGLPPTALARKYRALRAAVLLSRPDLTTDEIAAVQDHFYDQPHMIREMRLFAGRTPARIADPDTPFLSAIMDLRNFREKSSRLAPIPDDLRA
ncbi:helix-turn-helix domain-containing protein [Novosphingobium sp. Gsoil 351]|uniref:helix-turn-helix domain-containing protein n=1 Tax=Novosphingobium sp. Gsoil 351 TaxID=2675225 RepID=UPI0012B4A760|nr:helix-turn-helix domain-containing protein [Novosphingobium sp. Gsoil 351]QGN55204.1 helix-turn-helix domain-containing protein [Novosphingobium sp. Gsoil 351]